MTFAGKRVLVVGLGASGWAASRALIDLGADVLAIESNASPEMQERAAWLRAHGATAELGDHDLGDLHADMAVASPGVPPTAPVLKALERLGVPVISEVELAYQLSECDFLAVTGTNGKTTTTSLLEAMLDRSGVPSVAAGNIGLPLIDAVGRVGKGGAIAVELSSFQLASIEKFRPKVAVMLNVAEDHTDWHGSIEEYARAKARIAENQTPDDFFVVNQDDPGALKLSSGVRSQIVPFSTVDAPPDGLGIDDNGDVRWLGEIVFHSSDISLPGRAGSEDTLAAAAAALSYGIDVRHVVEGLKDFKPLRHRMEEVARVDGVRYIDDSKATNPHATLAAVSGLTDVVLIAGGRSKGIDLSVLSQTVPPVIAVVALGEATEEIASLFNGLVPVDRASSMPHAVAAARARSVPGGSVLLAPGCASLDMYKSYSERGDDFARSVRDLKGDLKGGDS